MCNLIQKYNVAGPRYTSYPTVPYWNERTFSAEKWEQSVKKSFKESNDKEGISLYIHLPFCENMCTFCGCHKRITRRHDVEEPYIESLLKEWTLYCGVLGGFPKIKEIHLGGGTPTFFSPENLEELINGIFKCAGKAKGFEFSFEGHPNNTTREHLETLYKLGFTRVSYGIQDYSEKVQRAINRVQPFTNVEKATVNARETGYTSIGHDLIFGLPYQTENDIIETIEKTRQLLPHRIAFYSYAHVPWLKGNGQRGYDEKSLPTGEEKRRLYETGKKMLTSMGYIEIGMDHFALKSDSLYKAMVNGDLHRNFMGYTSSKTKLMIGLGVSSISDSWYGFAQNVKNIEEYHDLVHQNIIPVYRGHLLSGEDLIVRRHILNLMCRFQTSWEDESMYFEQLPRVLNKLTEMEKDELVLIHDNKLEITEKGKPFVRNVCMAFDVLLQQNKPETQVFSMTV
ncbi:oxygen-independent coproporphyrinogen III oxidase [Abyssalbus ytuae]|uniref:Coproporphyrinogen-III oxidase n=1 Tax=Abyssalbus ytuae TaxID=2926907 RepID=A0A9E6ZXV1_9FLAO|nr:oxygen-independent coproporphyrinogen III oxidase [Abyssalbus ytuae]UOB18916.1 oxygen-independent coproporphyrinogen III oxidase [Abyssalbus ytuae]